VPVEIFIFCRTGPAPRKFSGRIEVEPLEEIRGFAGAKARRQAVRASLTKSRSSGKHCHHDIIDVAAGQDLPGILRLGQARNGLNMARLPSLLR
jgi:hypothetical protein